MPTITVRNIPEEVHQKIRIRAAKAGRSMEAEVREILSTASENPVDFERARKAIRVLQAEAKKHRKHSGALDEFIADRREEAKKEIQSWGS